MKYSLYASYPLVEDTDIRTEDKLLTDAIGDENLVGTGSGGIMRDLEWLFESEEEAQAARLKLEPAHDFLMTRVQLSDWANTADTVLPDPAP